MNYSLESVNNFENHQAYNKKTKWIYI